jgi:uncharacterized peroxidase-related enzyme
VKRDWRHAKLSPRYRALAEFAEKVTRAPAEARRGDLDGLRATGLSDTDILGAVQVISYFNDINRVADALGIDPEPEMQQAWQRWHSGG